MNPDIKKYLLAFELEKIQEHKNMAVFPILCKLDHSPKYLTLKEALEKVVGSALVYNKKVIHTAFFRVSKSEKVGDMSSAGRRRGFRTGLVD